jgi:hypothetical protein
MISPDTRRKEHAMVATAATLDLDPGTMIQRGTPALPS